ncbi:MAG: response regulator transcription factor [Ignavibacteria bacterium]|jgi:DNA-binding response OmpR family regulator|nr:response regulator transcription factor [Ignavibacteria bacterium]MCU7519991.1 response regulator transcription factor [Ignavibacteria bacterium]MCU7523066.1 response regulator transcription factor [Ignavibacteria bacterium]
MKVLLVEDEKKVASFIRKGLEEEYYTVDVAFDGRQGRELALSQEYDLIILDIMLPYINGIMLLEEIRRSRISTPVLLLTARQSVENKVEGLDAGADDYLTKPFAFEELLARIRALLRRKETEKSLSLKAGDLTLDLQTHSVKRNGVEISLTPKEYAVLEFLLRNKNKVISRTRLSEHVYDYHFDTDTNVIDVYINKLRNKIDKDFEKQLLYTIRGVGYSIKE